jgi:hypothetical protein
MRNRHLDIDVRPPPRLEEPEGFDELPEWLQDEARARWEQRDQLNGDYLTIARRGTVRATLAAIGLSAALTSATTSPAAMICSAALSAALVLVLRHRESDELSYALGFFATTAVPIWIFAERPGIGALFILFFAALSGVALGFFARPKSL